MFERHSPLEARLTAHGRAGAAGGRPLRIREVRGWHLIQLSAFGGRDSALRAALEPVLGGPPPRAAAQVAHAHARIYGTAQGQYWIIATDAAWLAGLAGAVPPGLGCVTPLSHSRLRLGVQGPPVRQLLAKGIAIDLHPDAFPVGAFAQTGLHHTGIFLERSGDDRFELYVQRTFAAWIWDWLIDAALPLGFDVGVEDFPPC